MDDSIRRFFARYEQFFLRSLAGEPDPEEVAGLYAEEFIACGRLALGSSAGWPRTRWPS